MAERDMYEGRARSAAAAAEEGLQRLSSLSIASTAKYTTSVSRAFNEMKKDIERLAFAATDTGGSNRVAKLRDGQALYMDERSRQPARERAIPESPGCPPGAYPVPTRVGEARPSQFITVQIYNPLSEQNWQKIVEDNIVPALRDAGDRNIAVNMTKMA